MKCINIITYHLTATTLWTGHYYIIAMGKFFANERPKPYSAIEMVNIVASPRVHSRFRVPRRSFTFFASPGDH